MLITFFMIIHVNNIGYTPYLNVNNMLITLVIHRVC